MPILHAPILEQAGFVAGNVEPVNYFAKLNGVDQYWELSEEIPIPNGGSMELDLMYDSGNQSGVDYVLTSDANSDTSLFFSAMEVLRVGSSGYISDVFVDDVKTMEMPYDSEFHTIKCVVGTGLAKVGILGARFDYTRNSSGAIRMFRVRDAGGVVINEIPLSNKAQGATQIATVGSVDATMGNYTLDVWEKYPLDEPDPTVNNSVAAGYVANYFE